jgi:hypothetical protein
MMAEKWDASDLDVETVRPIDLGSTEALKPGSKATPMSTLIYAVALEDMETAEAQITDDIEWGVMPYNKVLKGKAYVMAMLKTGSTQHKKPVTITNAATKNWGVYEYWNIGTVTEDLIKYGNEHHWPWPMKDPHTIVGQGYRISQCFVYHINAEGKIDFMRQYLDTGSAWAQFK